MLFHAPQFLALFLPLTLAGWFLLARVDRRLAIAWLVVASVVFYGFWRTEDLWVLAASVVGNWLLGRAIARTRSRLLLIVGIAANLALLGWFKYLTFALDTVGLGGGAEAWIGLIVLPLGISFFTFQQIAYLVDAADGISDERDPLRFGLFVTFFPQLVAGPIVHQKEMLPQFDRDETYRPRLENIAVGLSIFGMGLFKKVVLADGVAPYANDAFAAAAAGTPLTLIEAWAAALAFTFEIYFDFSGYSDMAVGLGRMFGIRLPANFASPFKAASIITYWQRWHITLTRFLTAYVYTPMAVALTRRRARAGLPLLGRGAPSPGAFVSVLAVPTVATMTLAGVWHGAGWQFLLFGVLHGTYLAINHAWRLSRPKGTRESRAGHLRGVVLTFLGVVVAMVVFRSESVPHALSVLGGMAGLNGVLVPQQAGLFAGLVGIDLGAVLPVGHTEHFGGRLALWLSVLSVIVWGLPNTQSWVGRFEYGLEVGRAQAPGWLAWRPSVAHGAAFGVLFGFALLQAFSAAPKSFIYFNF